MKRSALSLGLVTWFVACLGTYFVYFLRRSSHQSGSYLPLEIAAVALFAVIATLHYRAQAATEPKIGRLAIAFGSALIQSLVFVGLMLGLLISAFGS